MSSVSGTIPNVIGGISQQPPAARLENTASDLKNGIPSVVSGLRKRPPLRYIGNLMDAPTSSIAQFELERSDKPTKFITIADGAIKVFSDDGSEEPVTVEGLGALSYLVAADPRNTFGFLSIADTVFVFNKAKVVETTNAAETRPDPFDQFTMVIENVAANAEYELVVTDGATVQDGSYTTTATPPSASAVAELLATNFNVGAGGLDAIAKGNVITMQGATDYEGFDNEPASLTRIYRNTVARFTNLPPNELNGRLVEISGNPEDTDGSYWVEYNLSERLWRETFGWEAQESLNAETMPHILVDDGDGTWTLREFDWGSREAGTADSNPTPSFVGYTIEDMFMVSNRMAILADENIILSEIGEYANFYRTTCTTLLDNDRIDAAALNADSRVAKLFHAVDFDDAMLLFSDKSQFKIETDGGLSPNTMNIKTATTFSSSKRAAPTKLGTNVIFVDDADNSSWADLREYLVDNVVGVNSSEIITKQVPEFIPTGVYKITTNPTLGMALIFTAGRSDRLFVYNHFWTNGERLQSAWSYWEDASVEFVSGVFVGNRLYVTLIRDGKLVLTDMDLQETLQGDFDGLEVLLDYRVDTPSVVFDGTNSVVTLPYQALTNNYTAVLTVDGVDTAGTAYEMLSASGAEVTFANIDLTGEDFLIGAKYDFIYELSPIFLRDKGAVPIQDGRLQLRYLSFLYHLTSYFRVEVTPVGRDTYTSVYAGRTLGRLTDIVGEVAVDNGEFRVAASGEADRVNVKIINDSPFNSRFSSIEWEGSWRPRTNRLR